MFCPNCGTDCGEFKFCPECGAKLPGQAQPRGQAEAAPTASGPQYIPNAQFGTLRLFYKFHKDYFTIGRRTRTGRTLENIRYSALTEVVFHRQKRGPGVLTVCWRERKTLPVLGLPVMVRRRMRFHYGRDEAFLYISYCFFRFLAPPGVKVRIKPAPMGVEQMHSAEVELSGYYERYRLDRTGAVDALCETGMGRGKAVRLVDSYFDLRDEALYRLRPEQIREDMMAQGWSRFKTEKPEAPKGARNAYPAQLRRRLTRQNWKSIPAGQYYAYSGSVLLAEDGYAIWNKFAHNNYVGRFKYDRLAAIHYQRAEGRKKGALVFRWSDSAYLPIRPRQYRDFETVTFGRGDNARFRSLFFLLSVFASEFTQCTILPGKPGILPPGVDLDGYFDRYNPDSRAAIAALCRDTGTDYRNAARLIDALFERRQAALYAADPMAAVRDLRRLEFPGEGQAQQKCGRPTDSGMIVCPKCFSTNVVVEKRGYDFMRSLYGEALFDSLGALLGFAGYNDPVHRCLNCGHEWEP